MGIDTNRCKSMKRAERIRRSSTKRVDIKPHPEGLIPIPPDCDGNNKILVIDQDLGCAGGQRIQIISKQGHEIILLDAPSGLSKIQITTSNGGQQITMDEIAQKFYIGIADINTELVVESDGPVSITARNEITINTPKLNIHGAVSILGKLENTGGMDIKGDVLVNGLVQGDIDDESAGVSPSHKFTSMTDALKKKHDHGISHPPISPVSKEECQKIIDEQIKTNKIDPDHIAPCLESYRYTSEIRERRTSYIDHYCPEEKCKGKK